MTGVRRGAGAGGAAHGAAGPGAWIVRQGWLAWALMILAGGIVPVAQILKWDEPGGWSLAEIFGGPESEAWSAAASAAHTCEFFVMAILLAVAWRWRVPGSTGLVPAAVLSMALGLLVEVIQGPLPWRDFGLGDLAFDAIGVGLGLLALVAARRLREASGWSRAR